MKTFSIKTRLRKMVLIVMVGWMFVVGSVAMPANAAVPPLVAAPGTGVAEMGVASGPGGLSTSTGSSSGGSSFVITIDFLNISLDLGKYIDEMKSWGESLGLISDIIQLGIAIYDLLAELLGGVLDSMASVAKALLGGKRLVGEAKVRAAQAKIDANASDTKAKVFARIAADHAATNHGHLCRTTLISQLATTTEQFEEDVASMVMTAMQTMYRGEKESGNTAMFAARLFRERCYNKFASPVDGYPNGNDAGGLDCVDTETKVGPFERTFIDMDIMPFSMDGSIALELPYMETREEDVGNGEKMLTLTAKPENENQKAWVAALNYCVNLVGPRPTPPYGKNREKPSGLNDAGIFDQGLAMESAFDQSCALLLAHYTRPNISQHEALVKSQNDVCLAAKGKGGANGILTNKTIEEKFDKCEKGLSPYQASYLNHAVCKSPEHYFAMARLGAKHRKMMVDAIQCGMSWNMWQKVLAKKQGSLVGAVEGQMAVKEVYAGMSSAQTSAFAPTGMSLYSYVLDEMGIMPESDVRVVNAPQKQQKKPVKATPISADTKDLPQVWAQ